MCGITGHRTPYRSRPTTRHHLDSARMKSGSEMALSLSGRGASPKNALMERQRTTRLSTRPPPRSSAPGAQCSPHPRGSVARSKNTVPLHPSKCRTRFNHRCDVHRRDLFATAHPVFPVEQAPVSVIPLEPLSRAPGSQAAQRRQGREAAKRTLDGQAGPRLAHSAPQRAAPGDDRAFPLVDLSKTLLDPF